MFFASHATLIISSLVYKVSSKERKNIFFDIRTHTYIGSNLKPFLVYNDIQENKNCVFFSFNEITFLESRIYSYEEVRSVVVVLDAGKRL